MRIVSEKDSKTSIGQVFGKYAVLGREFFFHKSSRVSRSVVCVCECGVVSVVNVMDLLSGRSRSCGCRSGVVRGCGKTLLTAYTNMMARCYHPQHPYFSYYGGRGIVVCDEWVASAVSFAEWARKAGHCKGLTLDRIDNNGPYSPSNCRWITMRGQANNRRSNRRITIRERCLTVAEWSAQAECSVSESVIRSRLALGWPGEKAVMAPKYYRVVT